MAHSTEEHYVVCTSIFGYQNIKHLFGFFQSYCMKIESENNYLRNTEGKNSQPTS